MSRHNRLESGIAALAIIVCIAFVVSFIMGLGGEDGRARAAVQVEITEDVPNTGRLEVLNASDINGMARAATQQLRDAGYDVVSLGNAPAGTPDSSVVIDRVGRIEFARDAGDRIGIDRVITRVDTTLYLDATVIIGSDWRLRR